jgi:hypothetical protein
MDHEVQRSFHAVSAHLTVHQDALRAHKAEILAVRKAARADVERLEAVIEDLRTETAAREREHHQAVQVAKRAASVERAEIIKAAVTAAVEAVTPALEALARSTAALAEEMTAPTEQIAVRDPETKRILSVIKRRVA